MEYFNQFADLPPIQIGEAVLSNYVFPGFYEDYHEPAASSPVRLVHVFGQDLVLSTRSTQTMNRMERFFSEGPPFAPALPQPGFGRPGAQPAGHRQPALNRSFEPRYPWPSPEEYRRYGSPDESISSWKSMNSYPSDGSPSRFPAQLVLDGTAEGSTQAFGCEAFAQGFPFDPENASAGGSGVALSAIQGVPDEDPAQYMDLEPADVKAEYAPFDHDYVQAKMDVDDDGYQNDRDAESSRDAESVRRIKDSDSDSDYSEYKPQSPRIRRRPRRNSSHSSMGSHNRTLNRRLSNPRKSSGASVSSGSHKVRKKQRTASSPTSPTSGKENGGARHFPCPLAAYSCTSTFSSKNEWKRHVHTQHIRPGYWRCDLCPDMPDNTHNDFNRKDLFTQHLRRMHMRPSSSASRPDQDSDLTVTGDNLSEIQDRCYRKVRDPPARSGCMFCPRTFQGEGSWSDRMEHVGKHLERERKSGVKPTGIESWNEDTILRDWLEQEGLISRSGTGEWKLGNGISRAVGDRNADDEHDDGQDGEGEDE